MPYERFAARQPLVTYSIYHIFLSFMLIKGAFPSWDEYEVFKAVLRVYDENLVSSLGEELFVPLFHYVAHRFGRGPSSQTYTVEISHLIEEIERKLITGHGNYPHNPSKIWIILGPRRSLT